jgi:ADP-heptose:LPS heptosyltransferase
MKVLLLELWGLGDAVLMTTALRPLLAAGASVTVLAKPATIELLRPSYPAAEFISLTAPWTAFRGKDRLASWPWRELAQVVRECRRRRFDAAASVRNDPRDHLLMFLFGARRRVGFPRRGSGLLLTRRLAASRTAHRVDLWREVGRAVLGEKPDGSLLTGARPHLSVGAYGPQPPRRDNRPLLALHCGAKMAVRRWDEGYFATLVRHLRQEGDFHLALFPDTDGYGLGLLPLADSCHEGLSLPHLVRELAACDALICNDSGPGHIAAAFDRPVLAIFGPGDPCRFPPYGEKNHIVIRDICPYRPCYDNCRFPEPICLTRLLPETVWPEVRDWFRRQLDSRGAPRFS